MTQGGERAAAYAVVDVETTGLDPEADRVLEVAIVRTDATGRVTTEYASTLDPGGPVRLTEIHGLTDQAVLGAPAFPDVAAAVAARLTGAVVVGHNVGFDLAFLRAEYRRAGIAMPVFPALCTRMLAERLGRTPADGWNLASCCLDAGVTQLAPHTALGDARSTAALLCAYLALARAAGQDTLAGLGCDPPSSPPQRWVTGAAYSIRQHRRGGMPVESVLQAPAARLVRGRDAADALEERLHHLG
jgi:DNA polymerase III epsilon subunit-like protein